MPNFGSSANPSTRSAAVTVRFPGESSAPTTGSWTCGQIRAEKGGANLRRTPVNHFGSSAILKSDRGSSTLLPLSMAKVQLRAEHEPS